MHITAIVRSAAVVAGLALLTAPATAQGTAQERSACEGDAFKFCSADIPDISKIETCLASNLSKLSSACQAEFDSSAEKKTKLQPAHFN